MTTNEVLDQLQSLGLESYKKTMLRHGAQEPCFGVKIQELKKLQKRIKTDYRLALALYDSGVYDAMYLAGLIADDARMTRKQLQHWLAHANCSMLREYIVPWVATGSIHGWELAREWIDSDQENVADAGWATLGSLVSVKDDSELDIAVLKRLLLRVQKRIHREPNRVRYVMNGFVISVGCYVQPLTELALQIAEKIGTVTVETVGDCKVPNAPGYIQKVQSRGTIGKKRKSAKC